MVVIIPHPTEELKLIKLQKKLIQNLFSNDLIIYRQIPLLIELPFEEIQQIKNTISSVVISQPVYNCKTNQITCPAEITVENTTLHSELALLNIKFNNTNENGQSESFNSQKFLQCLQNEKDSQFPMSLSIFKLALCSKPQKGMYQISSVCWKKLKK